MRSSFGKKLNVIVYGESHGQAVGIVCDNFPSGIKIDDANIQKMLSFRRPFGKISTPRVEPDHYQIISGIFNGISTGAPLNIEIINQNVKSADYDAIKTVYRPSHADFTTAYKYHHYNDYRGGGHTSGRLTTGIVALGAICQQMLASKKILVGSHILQIKNIKDRNFDEKQLLTDLKTCQNRQFSVLSDCQSAMFQVIEEAAKNHDSVGGIIETAILNLPVGIGQPMFHSIESELSSLMFSIGGVKGIEFGLGFGFKDYYGSEVNDEFVYLNDQLQTKTNNNGGINGGISNGMPIIFKTVVKPTPSISQVQNSVDYQSLQNVKMQIKGRHDPCIVHRIRAVVDALTAIYLVDALLDEYGDDYFLCKED